MAIPELFDLMYKAFWLVIGLIVFVVFLWCLYLIRLNWKSINRIYNDKQSDSNNL